MEKQITNTGFAWRIGFFFPFLCRFLSDPVDSVNSASPDPLLFPIEGLCRPTEKALAQILFLYFYYFQSFYFHKKSLLILVFIAFMGNMDGITRKYGWRFYLPTSGYAC